MLVQYPYLRSYLFSALATGPEVFPRLLAGLTTEEADHRPDPNRFTIREIMAHLADWEQVFQERMQRMVAEDAPTIPGSDEGQRAIDNNYAATDPMEQTALFSARRAATVDFLNTLTPEHWERTALRPEIGPITVETQALLLPLHDLYHLRQVTEWRDR